MKPRVVLVEDDASLRRFVRTALEDLAIELICCETVVEALAVLQAAPAALVLTDLMLPGDSGLVLVERLTSDPGLRGAARIAVFSAGIRREVRENLERLGVWRIMVKPVSLAELVACVEEGLAADLGPEARPGKPEQADGGAPDTADDRAAAVARHFGGDRLLFDAFLAGALRRVAHSLKTVLQLLGHPTESELAGRVEDAAERGDLAAAAAPWAALIGPLRRLSTPD